MQSLISYRVAYAALDALMIALRDDGEAYRTAVAFLRVMENRLKVPKEECKYQPRDERRTMRRVG